MTELKRRVLRTSECCAQLLHRCDFCDDLIFPGDVYTIRIEVGKIGLHRWFSVRKEHLEPQCPYDEDDPDARDAFINNEYSLPLAA